jgi:hypothetical protein
MLAEQAQDAIFASADALVTQASPDLPVAFCGVAIAIPSRNPFATRIRL